MAYELIRTITVSPKPANALAKKRFVVVGTGGFLQYPTVGGDAVGITTEASAAMSASVISIGLLDGSRQEVEAGTGVLSGASISTDATGRCITADSSNAILGVALTTAAAAGEFVEVLTTGSSRQKT